MRFYGWAVARTHDREDLPVTVFLTDGNETAELVISKTDALILAEELRELARKETAA